MQSTAQSISMTGESNSLSTSAFDLISICICHPLPTWAPFLSIYKCNWRHVATLVTAHEACKHKRELAHQGLLN